MCLLCVISRWSRRVATMLPWLVIPFIIVWALSQLLPPNYRLEVTSSRLACLGVLLSSLVWYELLMPWLSSWRAHRSALLRERKLIEAQEAAKWRKEATRRCRNCLTAYKVQTPGGGRFMCTYCGHISKRPVLEVPGASASSGFVGLPPSVYSSGGNGEGLRLLKAAQRGSQPHVGIWSRDMERNRCAWFGESIHGADKCSAGHSLPGAFMFVLRILSLVGRKLLGVGQLSTDGSRGSHRGTEDLDDFNGSRGEKARRKANEKKQARLEKERIEMEERKQREEVARLVEERRRQRDKELEFAKERERESAAEIEREARRVRDTERREKDKFKEKIREPVTDGLTEQELHQVPGSANKTTGEISDRMVSPGSTSAKVAESAKRVKVSKGVVQDHVLRYKSTTDNFARLGLLKHSGTTTQRALASTSKLGTLYQSDGSWRGKKDSAHMVGKMTKSAASVASGSSSSSPKSAGAPCLSGSAWKRAPWISAWGKGREGLTGDSNKTQTGLVIGNGQRLDQIVDGRLKSFNNNASVIKPSLPPVRGTAIQPPIAPPLTHIDPLQQLFSTPSIFSPMDLPVDLNNQLERMPQSEAKASFLPEYTFFEAQTRVTFQSSNSFAPSPTSTSLHMSMPVLNTTPLQPTFGGSESSSMQSNAFDSQCFLSPEALYDVETVLASGITSESQSHPSVSNSDPPVNDNSISSPLLDQIKVDESDSHIDKEDARHWVVPPISLENTDEDALQLPPLSTVQSFFDSENLMPDRCLPHKEGSPKMNDDDLLGGGQGCDRKSVWSDFSAFDTAVRIWDDGDSNQKVPPEFVDCITREVMEDPVITADGHSYERTAIVKWLKYHDTSPKTGEVLPPPPGSIGVDKTLRPNHILRGQIIEYKERLARMCYQLQMINCSYLQVLSIAGDQLFRALATLQGCCAPLHIEQTGINCLHKKCAGHLSSFCLILLLQSRASYSPSTWESFITQSSV